MPKRNSRFIHEHIYHMMYTCTTYHIVHSELCIKNLNHMRTDVENPSVRIPNNIVLCIERTCFTNNAHNIYDYIGVVLSTGYNIAIT